MSLIPGVPAEYQPYLSSLFLAALVTAITAPFKKTLDPTWLPLVDVVVSVALNLAVALATGAPLLLAGLLGVMTGLIAGGLYQQGSVTTFALSRNLKLRRTLQRRMNGED